MSKIFSKELTILIAWHNEIDEKKIACFKENKRTIEKYNPDFEIITIISPFNNSTIAWLSSDLTIFYWYNNNYKNNLNSERFLLLEWDCWCDIDLKEYYDSVWNCDVVAPSVKYPERDSWQWFETIHRLPQRARLYATGIVPFCGILVSEKAMRTIKDEILKPEYIGLNSELRFATIATMLGFDPFPNPVCSRTITWKNTIPFDGRYKGLHHPRKFLSSSNVLDLLESKLDIDGSTIPKIIHQTWKDEEIPEAFILLSQTWKDLHPDWEYILWTDEMNSAFIERFFPNFLLQYNSYDDNIQRVDAARYFVLYKIGGLFIDMDFECTKNIESLIENKDCVFALEPKEHCDQIRREKIICNAFMASKPNNDFFHTICNSLPSFFFRNGNLINKVSSTTGSFALTQIYDNYAQKDKITVLASNTMYPLTVIEASKAIDDDIDEIMQTKIDKAYAVHYFLGTWHRDLENEPTL